MYSVVIHVDADNPFTAAAVALEIEDFVLSDEPSGEAFPEHLSEFIDGVTFVDGKVGTEEDNARYLAIFNAQNHEQNHDH